MIHSMAGILVLESDSCSSLVGGIRRRFLVMEFDGLFVLANGSIMFRAGNPQLKIRSGTEKQSKSGNDGAGAASPVVGVSFKDSKEGNASSEDDDDELRLRESVRATKGSSDSNDNVFRGSDSDDLLLLLWALLLPTSICV